MRAPLTLALETSAETAISFQRTPAHPWQFSNLLISPRPGSALTAIFMSLRRMSTAGGPACRVLVTLCMVVTAVGRLPAAEQMKPPGQEIRVELKKAGDRAEVGKSKEAALVTVHSESGIGVASLIRPEGGWPQRVVIRLDLKGLESLRIENGRLWSVTSLGGERRRPYWKTGQTQDTEATAAGHLEFSVRRFKGGVEVEVPRELLDTRAPVIKLEWVDFYR